MSRYTRTKRGRRRSHYPERLAARGLKTAPVMETAETLRKHQERRYAETGAFWWRSGSAEDRRETGEPNT